MTDSERTGGRQLALLVLVLTAVVMGVTVVTLYFVSPPPMGFVRLALMWFLCGVELIVGLMAMNALAPGARGERTSGALMANLSLLLVRYAVVGLIIIVLYSLFRSRDGSGDSLFCLFFFGGSTLYFALLVFTYGWDRAFAKESHRINEARAEHRDFATPLSAAARRLRSLTPADPGALVRVQALVKRIDTARTALQHSHGGGVGSREQQARVDLAQHNAALDAAVGRVSDVSAAASAAAGEALQAAMNDLDGAVADLEARLEAARLV